MTLHRRHRRSFSNLRLEGLERRQLLTAMDMTSTSGGMSQSPAMTSPDDGTDCCCVDALTTDYKGSAGMTREALEASATLEWQRDMAGGDSSMSAMTMPDDDPSMNAEHMAVMKLVSLDAVTNLAIADGNWSDPNTWLNRSVPAAGAKVWIMPGRNVTVDRVITASFKTVRVDGTLKFAPDVDTALSVDTMVVAPGGTLQVGTAAKPIAANRTATITFADLGAIDRNWDPYALSRGLVSLGTVEVHGADVTGHVALATAPKARDTVLTLAQAPTNWRVGDRIVLTGAVYGQDEIRTIRSINGAKVEVAALSYNHVPPTTSNAAVAASLKVYAADLDRNVRFQSQNTADISRRGHFMSMHSPDVAIFDAGFYGMGRTDKSMPINDPVVDSMGHLKPGTGTNPRARYAVHFHRLGSEYDDAEATIQDSVVDGSPGWGIVNHSSRVNITDNTVYNATGAGFVTEAGDETGEFVGNIAIGSTGSKDGRNAREDVQDFGFQGNGFWFQGPYVTVTDNIASGQKSSGFSYWGKGLIRQGDQTTFPADLLSVPSIAQGASELSVSDLPITFLRNQAFATDTGLEIFTIDLRDADNIPTSTRSVIGDSTFWGLGSSGVYVAYSKNITFRNVKIVSPSAGGGIGMDSTQENMGFENLYVDVSGVALRLPNHGDNWVTGGYYNAKTVFNVPAVSALDGQGRTLAIVGATFGTRVTKKVVMDFSAAYSAVSNAFHLSIYAPDMVTLDGTRLFFNEQKPDAVVDLPWLPAALRGKTNRQIFDLYGLAIGGVLAPTNAKATSDVTGLVGGTITATAVAPTRMSASRVSGTPNTYNLAVRSIDGSTSWDRTPVTLVQGWNVLKKSVNGRMTTVMVYIS